MRKLGPTATTILGVFDAGLGGPAAPASVIAKILEQRKIQVSKANLLQTLDRLATKGELAKIARPKGGAVYTRPRNFSQLAGFRAQIENLPALNIRRKSSTTEKRYALRTKRAIKRVQGEMMKPGVHDHRYTNRPCPVPGCWAWPPEKAEAYLGALEKSKRAT